MQNNFNNNNESSKMENMLSDTATTAAVKAKLLMDSRVKSLKISVETVNGQVILRGDVTDIENRNAAISVAESVDGVGIGRVRFEHQA